MYGESAVSTILTLGVLMDAEENALNYVKYREAVKARIAEGMKNVAPVKLAEIRFNLNEAKEAWYLGVDDRAPDHEVLSLLGELYDGDDGNTFGEATRSKEFFIAQDPDYIVQLEIGTKFTAPSEINERFETNVNILKGTRAYDEGRVIGVSYDQMSSFGNFANGLVVAHLLYPDEFSLEEAQRTLQDWFDQFTPFEVNVAGGDYWYMYTGTGFPAK
jgi:ABC-type Fe3+-hydroxamate transport system substrate-binding protein